MLHALVPEVRVILGSVYLSRCVLFGVSWLFFLLGFFLVVCFLVGYFGRLLLGLVHLCLVYSGWLLLGLACHDTERVL